MTRKFKSFGGNMKALSNVIAVILLLIPLKSFAEEADEVNHLYYTFATQAFPELNEAINAVLDKTPLQQSSNHLTQVAIDVYKNWHGRVLQIKNINIPAAADTIVKNLSPKGFADLPKYQVLADTTPDWQQPYNQLIVRRFLHLLGIAFSQNPTLQSVKDHLERFFACTHSDCEVLADAQTDHLQETRITVYMQIYTDCINHPDLLKQNKIQLCEAFNLHPITESTNHNVPNS